MIDNISLLTIAPLLNIQLLLDGLFIGAIFALAAYGLALVWGVMNVKNLAQGEFVIMGGYFEPIPARLQASQQRKGYLPRVVLTPTDVFPLRRDASKTP